MWKYDQNNYIWAFWVCYYIGRGLTFTKVTVRSKGHIKGTIKQSLMFHDKIVHVLWSDPQCFMIK